MAAAWRVAIRESEGIRLARFVVRPAADCRGAARSPCALARIAASHARARRTRAALPRIARRDRRRLARRPVPDAPRARSTCARRARTSTSATRSTRVHGSLLAQVRLELRYQRASSAVARRHRARARTIGARVRRRAAAASARCSTRDVLAAFEGDPAARSVDEVLLCYPGVQAMIHHRIAHELYRLGVPLLARIVAELAHGQTGIDIHPGAHDRARLLHRPRHRRRDRRDRA